MAGNTMTFFVVFVALMQAQIVICQTTQSMHHINGHSTMDDTTADMAGHRHHTQNVTNSMDHSASPGHDHHSHGMPHGHANGATHSPDDHGDTGDHTNHGDGVTHDMGTGGHGGHSTGHSPDHMGPGDHSTGNSPDHMGPGGHSTGHRLTFYYSDEQLILFEEWMTDSKNFIPSCVGVALVAMFYEGFKAFREFLLRKAMTRRKDDSNLITGYCSCLHVVQMFLHVIQVALSYGLMLVFMTFNVWLCVSVLIGSGLGYLVFSWTSQTPHAVSSTEHCM